MTSDKTIVERLRACRVEACSGPDWLNGDATPELLSQAADLLESQAALIEVAMKALRLAESEARRFG